ncbi:MAG: glyoxalase, partial [Mesorhizobium sp.]
MKVRRIVANIETRDIAAAKRFYQDVLGLNLMMDHGWLATYGSQAKMTVQISFAV